MRIPNVRSPNKVLILALAIAVAVSGGLIAPALSDHISDSQSATEMHVVRIGEGDISSSVSSRLATKGALVEARNGSAALTTLDAGSDLTVIFDGDWLTTHRDDQELRAFLVDSAPAGVQFVVNGANTSILFRILHETGIYPLKRSGSGELRNPAYMNPPQVGFQIERGSTKTWPSILRSNSEDPETLANAVIKWTQRQS